MSDMSQSTRTLVVSDTEKCIAGQVIQIKTTDQNNNENTSYITSTIADITLKKPKKSMEIDYTSQENIMERIESVTYKTMFTSKLVNIDEITGKEYDESCSNLRVREIPGSQLIYYPPAGVVYFNQDNILLFRCVCINFMILHNIIPFKITNLNENQIFKLKRTGGFIQRAYLDSNSGIRVSKTNGNLIINIGFNSDHKQSITESNPFIRGVITSVKPTLSFNKSVILDNFCELNNISHINVKYNELKFTPEEITSQAQSYPVLARVLEHFNNKIDDYFRDFPENPYIKYNEPVGLWQTLTSYW